MEGIVATYVSMFEWHIQSWKLGKTAAHDTTIESSGSSKVLNYTFPKTGGVTRPIFCPRFSSESLFKGPISPVIGKYRLIVQ